MKQNKEIFFRKYWIRLSNYLELEETKICPASTADKNGSFMKRNRDFEGEN